MEGKSQNNGHRERERDNVQLTKGQKEKQIQRVRKKLCLKFFQIKENKISCQKTKGEGTEGCLKFFV